MATGSSTGWSYGPPRKPPLPVFAASDIYAGTLVKFVAPVSGSVSSGRFVQMVGSSNDKPLGVAMGDAVVGEPVAVLDRGEWPRVVAGGSVQPGEYVGVTAASEAAHPISGVVGKYPVLGAVAGASGTVTWAAGTSEEAANPNEKFVFYIDPTQLSAVSKYVGVLG